MEKYFDTGNVVKIKDRTSPYYNCEGVVMGPITGSNSVVVSFSDDQKFAFDKKFIEPKVKVTKSDYYDDSMRMDDIENGIAKIVASKENDITIYNPSIENLVKEVENESQKYEMVNHPKHYRPGTYEAINVIEAWDLNFSLGSAIKYISRCGLKPDASLDNKYKAIEDLRKAVWYLNREIERIDKTTVKNS